MTLLAACTADTRSSQVFTVRDRELGTKAVYRLEVVARGEGAVQYKFNSAFLPLTAIEIYEGKVPEPIATSAAKAIARVEPDQAAVIEKTFRDLMEDLGNKRSATYSAMQDDSDCFDGRVRDATKDFGALMDAVTLNRDELRSVGRAGSAEPSRRSRLVYAVSTKPVKLDSFEQEIRTLGGTLDAITSALVGPRLQEIAASERRAKALQAAIANVQKYANQVHDQRKAATPDELAALAEAIRKVLDSVELVNTLAEQEEAK